MSDRTIGDIANDNENYNTIYDEQPQLEQPKTENSFSFDFLKAKTGEGAISDYLNHPLNFNQSEGMARVIRGVTGLMGDLDLAIVDVFVGALDLFKSKTKGAKTNDVYGGASKFS